MRNAVRSAALACLLAAGCAPPAQAGPTPLGLNLSGVNDWSPELPFTDVFRTARTWISQAPGKPWGQGGPLKLTPDGNVAELAPGQAAETLMFVDIGDRYPAGEYVCLYNGSGEIELTGAAKVSSRKPGRIAATVEPARGQVRLRLTKTDPKNPVRDIRFIVPGFEGFYEQQPFHPVFLARVKLFACARFMDWGATNNNPVKSWADRTTPKHATQARPSGVALELQAALCNAAGVDGWFCVPHLADDGYVREMAKLLKATLDPARTVYLEWSNETWNGQFEQAKYSGREGLRLGLSTNAYEAQLRYSSRRSVEVFKLFAAEFGRDRLVRVLAAQSANPWTGTTEMDWQDAYKHADAVTIAPYFGGRLGDPKGAAEVVAMTPEQVVAECRKDIEANAATIKTYADAAAKRKLKLLAYEGGQHLVGHGGAENNAALQKLFVAANRHPAMADAYRADLESWFAHGGGLFCVFASVATPSKWGSWGLLEYGSQDEATAPKMRAVREFLSRP